LIILRVSLFSPSLIWPRPPGARRLLTHPRSHRVVLLFFPHIFSCQAGRVLPKPYIAGVYSMAYYTPGKLPSSSALLLFLALSLLLSQPR
jgi:hypothetical protein